MTRATAGYDVLPVWHNGQAASVGYVKNFQVGAGHRVGLELLRDGYQALRQRLPALTLASMYEDNMKARRLFTHRLPGVAYYEPWCNYRTLVLPAQAGPRLALEPCDEAFVARQAQRFQLQWRDMPGEMFALRGGCFGLWRRTVSFRGEWIDVTFVHHLLAENDDGEVAVAMVRAALSLVAERGGGFVVVGLALGHPLLLPLRQAFHPLEIGSVLHLLRWPDEPAVALDARPPGVEVATL